MRWASSNLTRTWSGSWLVCRTAACLECPSCCRRAERCDSGRDGCAWEPSEAEGEATSLSFVERTAPQALCAQPPACVLKKRRSQTASMLGSVLRAITASNGREPPVSASCFLGQLLTLRVEFDVGGDGGAESSSSRAECAWARVGRRCTESRSQVVGAAGSRVCRKAERSSPWTRLLSCDRSDFVHRR